MGSLAEREPVAAGDVLCLVGWMGQPRCSSVRTGPGSMQVRWTPLPLRSQGLRESLDGVLGPSAGAVVGRTFVLHWRC